MSINRDRYVADIAKSLHGLSDEDAEQTMAALLDKSPYDPLVRDHMRQFFREVDAMRRARRTLRRCFGTNFSTRAGD